MSRRMRLMPNAAVRAIAITATRTVMGRPSAARMSHMTGFLGPQEKRDEAADVALGHGGGQECAPDVDASQLILELCLGEQALRVGDLDDRAEPGVVAGTRVAFTLSRRGQLRRRVRGNGAGRL